MVNFCSQCGSTMTQNIPLRDNRLRFNCSNCDYIHYENPKIVVGTLPVYKTNLGEDLVLLCKRNIEPRLGYWTLPAGFLENGESILDGAIRETYEETMANVSNLNLYCIFNVIHANQIHIFFRSEMTDKIFSTTDESSEVALFSFGDIPWDELAFPTVHKALTNFKSDYKSGNFTLEMSDINKDYWFTMNKK